MPQQKDLKRLTRARMQKTGESYTAARHVLLAKKARATAPEAPPPSTPPPPLDFAQLAGVSDATLEAKTGCNWETWVRSLDAHDMASKPHREIAAFVHAKYDVSAWWAQTVTVGYERIKGLREVGQRRGGSYEANKSKTFPVPLAELYRACRDRRWRQRWLPGIALEVRTATLNRSLRLSWDDGTSVHFWFTPKGDGKSSVAIEHTGLASREDAEARKLYWGERLTALAELLTGR